MRVKPKCYGCKRRSTSCHAECPDYQEYLEQMRNRYDAIKQDRCSRSDWTKGKQENIRRAKERRQ